MTPFILRLEWSNSSILRNHVDIKKKKKICALMYNLHFLLKRKDIISNQVVIQKPFAYSEIVSAPSFSGIYCQGIYCIFLSAILHRLEWFLILSGDGGEQGSARERKKNRKHFLFNNFLVRNMDDLTRKGDSSRCSLNEIARAADRNGAFGKGVFCGWFAPLSTYRRLRKGWTWRNREGLGCWHH